MANNVLKLYPQELTEAVTITAVTQELALGAQTVNLTVAAGVAGVASLPKAPVGLVVEVTASAVNTTGTIALTDPKGTTYTYNADSESLLLMAVDPNVNASGDYYLVLTNTGSVAVA